MTSQLLLPAGYSEDAIVELTLAAAIGAAARRLDSGIGVLQEAGCGGAREQ